jgi:molybdenum cofactor cytidylyltransferase
MAEIVAILLAAGESTRMGRPKPLLPWAGTTLIEWQVAQLRDAGAGRVVAVLGHAAEEVEPAARASGGVIVVNESYRSGRATSLAAGAASVDAAALVLVLSVDQPRPAWVSRRLIDAWTTSRAPVVIPEVGGRRGHPVLLDGSLLPDLRAVRDETLGLRDITERKRGETKVVVFENSVVIVDLNTPEEYATALADFNRGAWQET